MATIDRSEYQCEHKHNEWTPRDNDDSNAEKNGHNKIVPKRERAEVGHKAATERPTRNMADYVRNASEHEHPGHDAAAETCEHEQSVDQRAAQQRKLVL